MAEYASNAKGNLGVTLGAIGTGLGALNGGMGNGILGGLFGNGWGNNGNNGCNNGWGYGYGYGPYGGHCGENTLVNRYEMGLSDTVAAKDSEIALLRSNIYQDQKTLELYRYIDGKLEGINAALAAQGVQNARTEDGFAMVRQDICAAEQRMGSKIKMEAERRCCADNAIVNYVNATFYPKQVADVTVAATNTAQLLYNPIPECNSGCCNG